MFDLQYEARKVNQKWQEAYVVSGGRIQLVAANGISTGRVFAEPSRTEPQAAIIGDVCFDQPVDKTRFPVVVGCMQFEEVRVETVVEQQVIQDFAAGNTNALETLRAIDSDITNAQLLGNNSIVGIEIFR